MEIKRGDTLAFIVQVADEVGDPLVINAADIRSQLRKLGSGVLVDEFKISGTETPGEYLFEAQADTADYPVATLEADIEFTRDGVKKSSQTFSIVIKEDITHE